MLSIGIDIGSFSVKVAKVRSHSKGYELVKFSEYPLPQDPNKDSQIDIIEILREIRTRFWEEGTQVVVGAHPYEVTLRRRDFPFRERHKILKSLPFELEDDIPFSAENSVFDARITHFVGPKAYVLACACPKDHLENILKKYSDGGLTPDIVSIDSMATASLFEEWREAPWEYTEDTYSIPGTTPVDLILNIGHRTTTASLIKDGYLLDSRLIDWGAKDMAEMLSAKYSMHYLEALKDLRKRAFILTNNEGATRDQVALSEVMKTSVDMLAQKLRLVLSELKSLHKIDYRQAVLIGGGSQLRNMGPYLTQKLEIATNRLGQLAMIDGIDFSASPNNEIAAVTAIGLATEGIRRPKNPAINLLKGDFAKQNQTFYLLWEKWGHTARIGALVFVALLVWGITRDSFTSSNAELAYEQLKTHAKNIMGLKGSSISDPNIRSYIKEQEQKLSLKEMIDGLQNLNSSIDILKKVSALAPAKSLGGLNIREFKVNAENVQISGEASRVEVITALQKTLKSLAQGGAIQTLPPQNATLPGYKSFGFKFKTERKSGVN